MWQAAPQVRFMSPVIDGDQALRQHEADLAQELQRIDGDAVDVAHEHVRGESSQFGDLEMCERRERQLTGRFEDIAEKRHRI